MKETIRRRLRLSICTGIWELKVRVGTETITKEQKQIREDDYNHAFLEARERRVASRRNSRFCQMAQHSLCFQDPFNKRWSTLNSINGINYSFEYIRS